MAIQDTDQMTTPMQVAGVNDQAEAQAVPTSPATTQTPNQVTPTPTPLDQHTGRFHKILSAIAGGDQQVIRDQQGNPVVNQTGQVQTRTMGKRSLGASILAGALSAMAANEANQPYRNGNGVWVNPSNQAVAAGEQAFQQSRPNNQIRQAQQQATNQKTQQYAIYKQNVDMFKLTHEMYHAQSDDQQAAAAEYKGTYDAGEQGQIPGYDSSLGDLSAQDAENKIKTLDPTTHMMVPNGKVVPILDKDGNPTGRTEMHWMVLPGHAGIPLTQDMIDSNPMLKGASVGKTIPLPQWLKLVNETAQR